MEDYKKANSSTTVEATDSNKPPADNEIRVTTSMTIKRLIEIGLDKLKEHSSIVVTAQGTSINKAITVVETIKRKLGGILHQYTQIGKVTSTEQWDPAKDNELDSIAVDTILPVIIIHLSSNIIPQLDTIAAYQEPHQYD
ncbi:hypothetical protein BC941DRAFT_430489 [Chlamydoabsidia padenii]|nr:hypothetical protein BC941DRAFT_430489 [Chlamydoabsidia padenii]